MSPYASLGNNESIYFYTALTAAACVIGPIALYGAKKAINYQGTTYPCASKITSIALLTITTLSSVVGTITSVLLTASVLTKYEVNPLLIALTIVGTLAGTVLYESAVYRCVFPKPNRAVDERTPLQA